MRYIKEKFRFMNKKGPETMGGGADTAEKQKDQVSAIPDNIKEWVNIEAHKWAVEVNADIFKTRLNELKQIDPELFASLEKSGVLMNGLENTQQFEKYKKFIEYLNFLDGVTTKSILSNSETSQEITVAEKTKTLKCYLELSKSTTTDKIWNKEFVTYKYLEAIFLDLHNMGYAIEKSGDDGYIVRDINTLKEVSVDELGVYKDLLLKQNNSVSYMDTAIMSNIMVRNPEFKDIMNQKDFVNKIFNDHGILSKRNDADKTKYLIVDKELIREEIYDKIESAQSIESHRELTYLLDFVENFKDGMHEDEFSQSNIYAKGFLEQKAFLNAFPGGKIPGIDPESKKSVPDQISDLIKNHKFEAVAVWLIAWLMGFKKTGISAIGVWLFGWAIWDIISWVGNKATETITWDENKIDPIEEGQLAPLIKMSEYQAKADTLFAHNYNISKWNMQKVSGQSDLYRPDSVETLEVTKLHRIINAITVDAIDADLRDTDENVASSLRADLWEEFYSEEEVLAFVSLLKNSTIKDKWDNTVLDYLSTDGKDILNKEYENIHPTGTDFDTEINSILWEIFTDSTDRNEKRAISEVKEMLASKFSTIDQILSKIQEWDFNLFTSNKQEISNALSYLEKNNEDLFTELSPVFEAYDKYLDVNSQIWDYEGIYDENIESFKSGVYNLMWKPQDAVFLDNVIVKITDLEQLKISDTSLLNYPEFSKLNTRIDKILWGLREVKEQLINNHEDQDEVDGEANALQSFETSGWVHDLQWDVNMRMNIITTSYTVLESATELGWVYAALEWIDKSFVILSRYNTELLTAKVTTTWNEIQQRVQGEVKASLKEFETKKIEFETKSKEKLEKYYTGNKEEIDKVKALSSTSNISKYIATLSATKEFLVEKGVILTTTQEQLIKDLAKNTQAVQKLLEQQKAKQVNNPTNQSNYDIAIQKYNEFSTWLEWAKNIAVGEMMMIDDKVAALVNNVSNALWQIDADKIIDKNIALFQRVKTEFQLGSPDEQAQATLELAKRVFGAWFMQGEPTTSLEDIKKAYDIKEGELETMVQSQIEVNVSSFNGNSNKMKNFHVELEKMKALFPKLEGQIDGKIQEVKDEYLMHTEIWENTVIMNAIKADLIWSTPIREYILILKTNNVNINTIKIDKFTVDLLDFYKNHKTATEKDAMQTNYFSAYQKADLVNSHK